MPLTITSLKRKSVTNIIYYIFTGNSHLIFSDFYPQLTKYLPFNQLWIVFGDSIFAQYLKSVSNLKKYKQIVKYFHAYLLPLIQDFYLSEVEVLFRTIVLIRHSIINNHNQESILELFKLAWDYANTKIIEKTSAYNKA